MRKAFFIFLLFETNYQIYEKCLFPRNGILPTFAIMILTTTPTIEGRSIVEYKGVVFGEVIAGVDFLKDIAASIRNFVGGRSASYEEELIHARSQAMDELQQRATQMGADAVVGIDIDYEVLGANNGMLMVTASGTAVKLG
jgi:uncharacterized protein YbjQ (UPF0145 family)